MGTREEGKMKKTFLCLFTCLFLCCSIYPQKVGRTKENGVEVIINHLEPYQIEGEPSELILEEEYRIDTEDKEMVEIGLTDMGDFVVDSKNNVVH